MKQDTDSFRQAIQTRPRNCCFRSPWFSQLQPM